MNRVGIFGPPRSGTSWLAHIFNSHPAVALRFQPLFSYGHKGSLSETSSTEEIESFFSDIEKSKDLFALMRTESQKNYPRFAKDIHPTHIVFKETRYLNVVRNIVSSDADVLVLGIIRNPLATLASWVCAPKEFSSNWDLAEEWRFANKKNNGRREECFGFERWKSAAAAFLSFEKNYPKRFKLIRYSDLNSSPQKTADEIFSFCELPMSEATKSFILESKSRHDDDPYSVFRANANDGNWHSVLPDYIVHEVFADLKGSALDLFLD